ncbi:MAG: thiamine pyrophosphate-binding protein [Candidatus Lokiarchaeota archaeon]|nr:thiamine pyrophosphate-binding protein [Candidatus Lokiarchaeota archaeon]
MEKNEDKVRVGMGITRMLKDYGVSKVFGIPDGHTLAFYDGILQTDGIDHILVNDERTAAFAADAYSRVTGGLGVCDAGAAGSMNFPVAISEARGSGTPLLAIIGVIKKEHKLRNVPHDIDVQGVIEPITKTCQSIYIPDQVPRYVNYAIRMAKNGKPGPTALIIPEDVMNSKELPLKRYISTKKGGSCAIEGCSIAPAANEIENAVQMIREAKQPAIFSGSQAVSSGAFTEIKKLADMLQIPVFSTISGKGILQQEDPYYFGTVGLFGEKPNHKFIRRTADLLIIIGNRMTEDDTANFKIPSSKMPVIQIDLDPGEIGLSFNAWGVVGDSKIALDMIIRRLQDEGLTRDRESLESLMKERKRNLEELKQDHTEYWERDAAKWMDSEPIKPQRVLYSISQYFTEEDYLVTDASASSRWIGPYFPVKGLGRKIITPRGVGPTGFGLGALLGTGIAIQDTYGEPTPKLVLLTGDGGLMNSGLSDLETIVQKEINCTIVVLNNSALGFVKFGQAMLYNRRYYDTDRVNTNFVQIAEAFGIKGKQVKTISQLDEAIKSSLHNQKGVQLIDVITDPEEFLPPNSY